MEVPESARIDERAVDMAPDLAEHGGGHADQKIQDPCPRQDYLRELHQSPCSFGYTTPAIQPNVTGQVAEEVTIVAAVPVTPLPERYKVTEPVAPPAVRAPVSSTVVLIASGPTS